MWHIKVYNRKNCWITILNYIKLYKTIQSLSKYADLFPKSTQNIKYPLHKKWSFLLRIWSHLLKRYFMGNFIFYAVTIIFKLLTQPKTLHLILHQSCWQVYGSWFCIRFFQATLVTHFFILLVLSNLKKRERAKTFHLQNQWQI